MSTDTKVLCPRCERHYYTPYDTGVEMTEQRWQEAPYPALSRTDNKTYICSRCGQEEAMRDFAQEPPVPPNEWPIETLRDLPWENEEVLEPQVALRWFEATLRTIGGSLVRVEVQADEEQAVRDYLAASHPEYEIVNVIPSNWRSG